MILPCGSARVYVISQKILNQPHVSEKVVVFTTLVSRSYSTVLPFFPMYTFNVCEVAVMAICKDPYLYATLGWLEGHILL